MSSVQGPYGELVLLAAKSDVVEHNYGYVLALSSLLCYNEKSRVWIQGRGAVLCSSGGGGEIHYG